MTLDIVPVFPVVEWRAPHSVSPMTIDYPWPETPDRVESRVRGLVDSVVLPGELIGLRIDWVTPRGHQWDEPDAGWIALRVTVIGRGDEVAQYEVWGPDWPSEWEVSLAQFASDLEDWVCETRFAWGQRRTAIVPD